MNRILVLGDTHGRTLWKEIIEKENPNFVVFLGDYVSTHGLETAEEQFHNLLAIMRYKDSCPDRVVLLRGNHDMQHLGYYWAECSGWNPEVHTKMQTIKEEFLNRTQWVHAHQEENKFFVFSHAGISNTWLESAKNAGASCITDINNIEPSELFGFTPDSMWDTYGNSITQPCTWIRPESLIKDMPEGIIQIVGHTPVAEKCVNLTAAIRSRKQEGSKGYKAFESVPDLWLCDGIGVRSYLMIEDGNVESKTI